VSPKTQPPTLPRADMAASPVQAVPNGQVETPKRKRETSETASPHVANGSHSRITSTPSPQRPVRKRRRYNGPPIWAQSFIEHAKAKERAGVSPNAKRPLNGRQADGPVKTGIVNGHHQVAPAAARPAPVAQVEFRGDGPLGPWEPSIIGCRPFEEVPKKVADWLYHHVVTRPDAGELASRGVEVEIEAKLGQLIDKATNERFRLPIESECILSNTGKVSFKSSMTEVR
jgi:polynucleotide 5'-triphosphatase